MSSSAASPPLYPGGGGGGGSTSAGSSNANNGGSAGGGNGKPNYLWLLFLIPIVLVAFALGLTVWLVCRRRRQRRARHSTLRNVTLIVQDEEKAREKQERRLTRGDSVASTILRRSSTLREKRQRKYSARIASAVAKENKEAGRNVTQAGQHIPQDRLPGQDAPDGSSSDTIPSPATVTAALSPISRRASVKHRDREIAQRVWKIPSSSDSSGYQSSSPEALLRNLHAANASSVAGPSSSGSGDLSEKDHSDMAQPGEGAAVGTSGGHVRPGKRNHDHNDLSIIGESGLSEGDMTREDDADADENDTDTKAATADHQQITSTAPPHDTPSATSTATFATAAAAPVAIAAGAQSAPHATDALSRNTSQRSAYTTATSRSGYTTADDMDNRSITTVESTGTARAQPSTSTMAAGTAGAGAAAAAAAANSALPVADEEEEGERSSTPRVSSSRTAMRGELDDQTDPFRSPDTAGTSSTIQSNPFGDHKAAEGVASQARQPMVVPAITTTRTSSPEPPQPIAAQPREANASTTFAPAPAPALAPKDTSLARKLSGVVRLKTPTPSRHRTPSPSGSNRTGTGTPTSVGGGGVAGFRRSISISSKSSRNQAAQGGQQQDLSLHKTPSSPKAARRFKWHKDESASTSAPKHAASALSPDDSWTYTSHAGEWKGAGAGRSAADVPDVVINGTGDDRIATASKGAGVLGLANDGGAKSRSGSSSGASSDPPDVPGERVWLAPDSALVPPDAGVTTGGSNETGAVNAADATSHGASIDATRVADDTTTTPTSATTAPPTGATGMQRKPSLGVAGSRFKESFE